MSNFFFTNEAPTLNAAGTIVAIVAPRIVTKQGLFEALASQLRFPGYFGHNWDALDECLRDLSWLPQVDRIVLAHRSLPLRPGSDDQQTYVRLLSDVLQQREENRTPKLVVSFPVHSRGWIEKILERKQ